MNNHKLLGIDNIDPYHLSGSTDLYRIEPPPMLIDGVLPRGSATGLTAVPGCGKTWLALEMMRAVATGGKFLNKYRAEQAGVLFVGSDASIYDYAQQWRRLTVKEWAELNPDDTTPAEYENPLDANVRFLIQSDFTFDSLDHTKRIISTAKKFEWGPLVQRDEYDWEHGQYAPSIRREMGFGLIIYDTYSKMTMANQNDNSEVENTFRNIRLIGEETGAAQILLHHNANPTEYNDGENWRGATSAAGALDNRIQLVTSKTDKYLITVKYKKFRGITPEPFNYAMNVDDENEATLIWTEEPSEGAKFDDGLVGDAVIFLNKSPGTQYTLKQIANALWTTGDHNIIFGNDIKKFQSALRRKLNNEIRTHRPRVVIEGGKGTNRLAFYGGVKQHDNIGTSGASSDVTEETQSEGSVHSGVGTAGI